MQSALLDLLGTDTSDMDIIKTTVTPSVPTLPISNSNNQDLLDLLGDLDMSSSLPPANVNANALTLISENNNPTIPVTNTNSNFLTGDFFNTNINIGKWQKLGNFSTKTISAYLICVLYVLEKNVPTITAFEKNGLKITFALERVPDATNTLAINVTAVNNTLSNMTDYLFQAAVPKVNNIYL